MASDSMLKFTKCLYQDFWILQLLGGTFGFYHTKWYTVGSLANYTVMYTLLPTVVVVLIYTNVLVGHSLSLVSQSCHMMIDGIVVLSASMIVSYKRKDLLAVADLYVNPYISEYSKNEYFERMLDKTRRNIRKSIFTWVVIYGSCGMVGLCQPLIDSFFDRKNEVTNVNGVWLNLPFIIWFPFDLEHSTGAWLVAYALEVMYLLYSATMVTGAITLCFAVMDKLLDQLNLLKYSILTLDERASALFRERYSKKVQRYKKLTSKDYDDCYYECLIQNVVHHKKILSFVKSFMFVAEYPLAVPFFGGAILLGMAAITLTAEDDPRMGPKFLMGALALSEAYNMYILSEMGQRFQDLSGELYDALYFTNWHERSTRCRKALIIMRCGCVKPVSLTLANLLVLNIKVFGDLVRSAYSIFNLKTASSTK